MAFLEESDLRETITLKSKTGVSTAGDPTYAAARTMSAKLDRGGARQVGTSGDQLDDVTVLYTVQEVLLSDLIWFPEDAASSAEGAHRPAQVEPVYDLDGVLSHYETTF